MKDFDVIEFWIGACVFALGAALASRQVRGHMSKRRPRKQTFTNLRTAVLKRWRDDDTPGKIAMRLDQPTQYVHIAIAGDVKRVIGAYEVGVKAEQIAADLELPRAFVVYVFRRINAVTRDRARKRHQIQQQGRRQQGADRRGCRSEQSPVSSGAVP